MGITSSKYPCSCLRPQSSTIFPEPKPQLYPDVIDSITPVCVPFSPGAIPRDIGASVYGSRHTFTRVTVGDMAHRAGIREGYQLISVNGENVETLRHDQVIKLFAGIEEAVHLLMRRQSGGSDASSGTTADTEIITAQLEVKEIIEPVSVEEAMDLGHGQVRLTYDVHALNQLHHQYGPWGGAILPGKRGGARKQRLRDSNRSDATIAVHSFTTIPPTRRGTYVVLEFEKIDKFFTCAGGNIKVQPGSQAPEIKSTEDARVFLMTDEGREDLKFESTKFPGKFLTLERGKVKLRSTGRPIESQYFKLQEI